MRDFLKEIENHILIHDGSKGYMLQKLGLKGGECGELWNLTNQEAVRKVYQSYLDAGSDVIQTNTFPGNRIHLHKYSLDDKVYEINYWGAKLAREAAGENKFVCASIGPTGQLFEPSGELSFEKAYEVYREQVQAVVDGGADIINFETFTDLAELRAALLAAKDITQLPVICSLAYENNGHTLMGTDPFIAVTVLKSLGADMAGTNCSFGPEHMAGIVKKMYEAGGGYLSAKPNAGLPQVIGDQVSYSETVEHFAEMAAEFAKYGARLIGGCCGTTPDFIRVLKAKIAVLQPAPVHETKNRVITSSVRTAEPEKLTGGNTARLDASQNEEFLGELMKGELLGIDDIALDLASEDYDAIYVNTDRAEGSPDLLAEVVDRLQWYIKAPLIIETKSPAALEKALRIYRGVAGVSLGDADGQREGLKAAAAKYGSIIVPAALPDK